MDSTLESFFKEINEIAPPKPLKEECFWKECYDELTGYAYYWNTKTDEVTWKAPVNFKPHKKTPEKIPKKKPANLFLPTPTFPSTSTNTKLSEQSFKIYSIGNADETNKPPLTQKKDPEKPKPQKRSYRRESDSEDEKITLISSYGGDSESETDDEPVQKKYKDDVNNTNSPIRDSGGSDEDDDIHILTKIQKRAQELRALGGDLPPEVAKIAEIPKNEPDIHKKDKKKPDVAALSLVAGYSDSEDENEEIKNVFKTQPEPPPPQKSHSTLFPITKPIDLKDFMQPKVEENKTEATEFDTKSFQRKRRIGVALVNTTKKKDEPESENHERRGFGFNADPKTVEVDKGSLYPGFLKGGVAFVKSDVLNPNSTKSEGSGCENSETEEEVGNRQEIVLMHNTLVEKLGFLNEGRPDVSPTQVMLIQAQTLFEAMRDNGLKPKYLQKWLTDTCSELVKLEKEATPEGWLLQWDRIHKRYYYLQPATGVSQWEYPTAINSSQSTTSVIIAQHDDDAMDISTTPPPEHVIRMSPPLPPTIRSPTPPPPPVISKPDQEEGKMSVMNMLPDVPLPPELPPPLAASSSINGQPLPPGVDLPDIVNYDKKDQDVKSADPLHSALNSFYSEVAAIDTPKSISPQPPSLPEELGEHLVPVINGEKKKKKKVKLAPGLSLKKKGVSQLVEKWKTVQQQYND